MALLERIESMEDSGMQEMDIINSLREEGISPREINEALSQSKIKTAVSPESEFTGMEPSIMAPSTEQQQVSQVPQNIPTPSRTAPVQAQVMQAPAPQQPYYAQETYAPQDQAAYSYPQDQTAYGDQYAPQDQAAYYSQVLDVETVRDIAKQEIEESLKKLREQLDSLDKMKTDLKFELQNMENRLSRIESIIQEVQSSIIQKMGQYGEAISGISSEVRATQQSFSKMLGPLMDKRRVTSSESEEIQERSSFKPKPKKQEAQSRPQSSSSGSASFEDYLR